MNINMVEMQHSLFEVYRQAFPIPLGSFIQQHFSLAFLAVWDMILLGVAFEIPLSTTFADNKLRGVIIE